LSAFTQAYFQEDLRNYKSTDIDLSLNIPYGSPLHDWVTRIFTKIVVQVEDSEELLVIYDSALLVGLPISKIVDNGLTIFKEPTLTCIGIGPALNKNINKITKHLKLYK